MRLGRDRTYMAWMIPGIQPRMVKQMLMSRSAPQPRSRKTPRGGRMMAKMILQMSLFEKLASLQADKTNRPRDAQDLRSSERHCEWYATVVDLSKVQRIGSRR